MSIFSSEGLVNSQPDVAFDLNKFNNPTKCVWLYGLPGSGKTTLAQQLITVPHDVISLDSIWKELKSQRSNSDMNPLMTVKEKEELRGLRLKIVVAKLKHVTTPTIVEGIQFAKHCLDNDNLWFTVWVANTPGIILGKSAVVSAMQSWHRRQSQVIKKTPMWSYINWLMKYPKWAKEYNAFRAWREKQPGTQITYVDANTLRLPLSNT